VDRVLPSEMVSCVPSCGVGLYPEKAKVKRRFVWIATFDITVLISGDKKFTVPTLIRNHASGWACDAWLSIGLLYAFDPSHMLHGKCLLSL